MSKEIVALRVKVSNLLSRYINEYLNMVTKHGEIPRESIKKDPRAADFLAVSAELRAAEDELRAAIAAECRNCTRPFDSYTKNFDGMCGDCVTKAADF